MVIRSLERTDLHRFLVNEEPIQRRECVVGAIGLVEDDSGDAAALTIGPVGDENSLDWADRFDEIFLQEEITTR